MVNSTMFFLKNAASTLCHWTLSLDMVHITLPVFPKGSASHFQELWGPLAAPRSRSTEKGLHAKAGSTQLTSLR